MNYAVVVVAAGKSTRFNDQMNKLLHKLSNGERVIDRTLKRFLEDPDCKQVIVVTGDEVLDYLINDDAINDSEYDEKPIYCKGGTTRSESVFNGLMAVNQPIVFVHDGARCYIEPQDLASLKQAMESEQAAMLVKDETDSIKKVDENGYVVGSVNRDSIKRAQTPQAFYTEQLIEAYQKAFKDGVVSTDDAGIMELYSDVKIKCVKSIGHNEKVTTKADIK